MTRACIIGAGLGGLALAIRLAAGGISTTLIEARAAPGGCAGMFARDGFTFETGPSLLAEPSGLAELWSLAGAELADAVELVPLDPFYRLLWPDGTELDAVRDPGAWRAAVAGFAPGDLAGYEEFAALAARARADGWHAHGDAAMLDWRDFARTVPALLPLQPWRSLHGVAARLIKSEKLRQAVCMAPLLVGGNPLTVSAVFAALHAVERADGLWWPRGGFAGLAAAMAALFTRLGGELRLGDAAVQIHTIGDRANEVETASGWRARFDAVASGADLVHTYRRLLADTPSASRQAERLARKRWSPGAFVVHFGLAGSFPQIAAHSILFGPRWQGLLTDIFVHGVLPSDVALHLHHSSAHDAGAAPPGCAAFTALMPVPHLGRLPVDWAVIGPVLAERILDAVAMRLVPDLRDRLMTYSYVAPGAFAGDFNWYQGAAWSLEPLPGQSGIWRAPRRDSVLGNLYLVGAGTHPGAGVPAVLAGARATAKLMLAELPR